MRVRTSLLQDRFLATLSLVLFLIGGIFNIPATVQIVSSEYADKACVLHNTVCTQLLNCNYDMLALCYPECYIQGEEGNTPISGKPIRRIVRYRSTPASSFTLCCISATRFSTPRTIVPTNPILIAKRFRVKETVQSLPQPLSPPAVS